MSNYLYVDNSNAWIEGMHVAAAASGMAPDVWTATQNGICDTSWKIDFGKLHSFAGGSDTAKAKLYGSRPPANDTLWRAAERQGFEVVVFDRSVVNREKKIDTQITADIAEDLYTLMTPSDEVTLVAGDKDYVPICEKVKARGLEFHVVFWSHASRELREACSKFVELNQFLEHLRR